MKLKIELIPLALFLFNILLLIYYLIFWSYYSPKALVLMTQYAFDKCVLVIHLLQGISYYFILIKESVREIKLRIIIVNIVVSLFLLFYLLFYQKYFPFVFFNP